MMNEDLLQDLVLYKKSHEKAVSIAARSLITLFREVRSFLANFPMFFFCMLEFPVAKPLLIEVQICTSLLVKDHGRPVDPVQKLGPKHLENSLLLAMCKALSC